MSAEMQIFDLAAPLRRGITLIEASAGTGKTYSIAGLFVRLIAEEGLAIDRVAVVTFTDAATSELKTRLRARLDEEAAKLRAEGPEHEVAVRRLEQASRDFDRAAISTIHGFCQRMLALHAFESGAELERELLKELTPLYEELVDDYRSRLLHGAEPGLVRLLEGACKLGREELLGLASTVLGHADAALHPDTSNEIGAGDLAGVLTRLEEFRDRYEAGRDGLVAYLCENEGSFKKALKVERIPSDARDLQVFLAAPDLSQLIFDEDPKTFVTRMSATYVKGNVRKGFPAVAHPLLDEWGECLAAARSLNFVGEGLAGSRLAFARFVREELPKRLAARGQLSFDGLIRSLSSALADESTGDALKAALRSRFDAVLLDEFQDTDGDQWRIFETAFGATGSSKPPFLYLIGDPKQAIYAFRGADVKVYAAASKEASASQRFTMNVNYRSDARVLSALNVLFKEPAGLFGEDFGYVPVSAGPKQTTDGVRFRDGRAPLLLRKFDGKTAGAAERGLSKGAAEKLLPSLVAEDIITCLEQGEMLKESGGERPVEPRDIAVLVRTGYQGAAVQAALVARGVSAVIGGADSVYDSDEARELELFLAALLATKRDGPVRAFALSRFGGLSAKELADEESGEWTKLLDDLSHLRRVAESGGVLRALHGLYERRGLYQRLAAEPRGERALVNLRHLEELLHGVAVGEGLGLASLLSHLRAMRGDESDAERDKDAETLRLESEEQAVRIVTVHKSKGLEYPIVFAPYLWAGSGVRIKEQHRLRFRDETGHIAIDLLKRDDESYKEHKAAAEREVFEEERRLAYVALTRAKHALVVYAAPVKPHSASKGYDASALAMLVHGRAVDTAGSLTEAVKNRLADALKKNAPDEAFAVFDGDFAELEAQSEGLIAVSYAETAPGFRRYSQRRASADALSCRTLTRASFDMVAGRHSYSGIVNSAAGRAHVSSAPGLDEGALDDVAGVAVVDDAPVPLSVMRAGAPTGHFVHALFERLDFRDGGSARGSGAPLAEYTRQLAKEQGFSDTAGVDALITALPQVFATPLGGPLGAMSLSGLAPEDRLNELNFDIAIGGGSRATAETAVRDKAFVELIASRSEGLRPQYAESLRTLSFRPLAGFLTGSMDLVFRAEVEGVRRYFVADYKSNRLAPGSSSPSLPAHYGRAGLVEAMEEHHYFIQSHLYVVALHRLLSSRLRERYDYDRDVGGAYYLFVRGMTGATGPEGSQGVFFDKPPKETIEALSRLLGSTGGQQ